jgi:signal transduction histidine kinase
MRNRVDAPSQVVDRVPRVVATSSATWVPEVARVWNKYRLICFLTLMILAISWELQGRWGGGLALALLLGASVLDAWHRQRSGDFQRIIRSVMVDVVVAGVGLCLIDAGPGPRAPMIYMLALPLLLLPLRSALPVMGVGVGLGTLSMVIDHPYAIPSGINRTLSSWTGFALFTSLLLILIAITARALSASVAAAERSRRGEAALARAGERLLATADQVALHEALEVLRQVTGATATFVAENSGDRNNGPAAVVTQVSAGADTVTETTSLRWTLPYMQHREKAAALARGETVRLDQALSIVLGRTPDQVYAVAVPLAVSGEWAGFLGIAHDLTIDPAPDLETGVLETAAVMVGSFLEKRRAYTKMEESIQARDQFLASVSHEIRTPLTSVLGFTALLREGGSEMTPDETHELITLIQHQAQEVSDLVEDLLVAARAEIDAVTVTKEDVDLHKEIHAVLAGRLGTETKDIVVAAGATHHVLADATRVRQIIRNLVTNALRYGGDKITVTTHKDGPEISLVFSDDGPGVPPELGKAIFDPYDRGEKGLSRSESVGLGLAVARQLARLMDGDLMLRTDLGPATFQLTLPAAPVQESEVAATDLLVGA